MKGDAEVAVVWGDNEEKKDDENVEPVAVGAIDVAVLVPVGNEESGFVDLLVSFVVNEDAILDMIDPVGLL